jgi:hypothetical protein
MELTALDLIPGALSLDAEAFRTLLGRPGHGLRGALVIVFLAGLSTAVGQSVMLFANRVSPRRFAASLLVQALLFVLTFLVWAATVWQVAMLQTGQPVAFAAAAAAIGLAYAPQLFNALVLTPYLGTGVGVVLSVWTLLATLQATAVAFDLGPSETLLVALAGWLVAQLLQRTVGRPVARIGRWVRHVVAGTVLRPFDPPPGMWPR